MMKYRQVVEQILNPEQIEALYLEYISGNFSNEELCGKYALPIHANKLYQAFPPVIHDSTCKHCSNQMSIRRRARVPSSNLVPFCSVCGHKESIACTCEGCTSMRRMQHSYSQPKQANVKKIYEVSAFSAYSYADLLLNEKLLLLSLFISGDVNESGDIIPLRNWRGDAAWGGERMFYLREMIQKQVLVVSPNTPQMVFNGGRQARAEIGLCYWRMNIRSRGEQLTHHDLSRKLRYDVLIIGLPPEAKYVLAEMVVMQMIEQIIQSVLSSRFEDLKISTAFRLECKSLLRELPVGKVCSRVRSVCAAMINDVPKSLLTKELADELLRSRVRHVKTPDAWSAFTPSVLPVATKLVVESILKVSMKGFVTNTIAYSVVGDV